MNWNKDYKLLSLFVIFFVCAFSYLLSTALLNWSPYLAFTTLIVIFSVPMLLLGVALIRLQFWKPWTENITGMLTWLIISIFLIALIAVNIKILNESFTAIELHHFGISAEAVIVDREIERSKHPWNYQITYSWETIEENGQRIEHVGQTSAAINQSSQTRPGTNISVRYLSRNPAISLAQEDSASAANDILWFFFVWNLSITLIEITLFWIVYTTKTISYKLRFFVNCQSENKLQFHYGKIKQKIKKFCPAHTGNSS